MNNVIFEYLQECGVDSTKIIDYSSCEKDFLYELGVLQIGQMSLERAGVNYNGFSELINTLEKEFNEKNINSFIVKVEKETIYLYTDISNTKVFGSYKVPVTDYVYIPKTFR